MDLVVPVRSSRRPCPRLARKLPFNLGVPETETETETEPKPKPKPKLEPERLEPALLCGSSSFFFEITNSSHQPLPLPASPTINYADAYWPQLLSPLPPPPPLGLVSIPTSCVGFHVIATDQKQVPKPYFYPVYKHVPVPVPKAVHKIVPVIKEKPVIVKKKVPIL